MISPFFIHSEIFTYFSLLFYAKFMGSLLSNFLSAVVLKDNNSSGILLEMEDLQI